MNAISNLETLTAFLIALGALVVAINKFWHPILNWAKAWSLRKAMDKHDNFMSDIRFWVRKGLQTGLNDVLLKHQFIDRIIVVRLAKNGTWWLSLEEDLSISKDSKPIDIHRTPAVIYKDFFDHIKTAKQVTITNTSEEVRFKKLAKLLEGHGVISVVAYHIPNSNIIVAACVQKKAAYGNEVENVGNQIARMHSTIALLYNYKIDFGNH